MMLIVVMVVVMVVVMMIQVALGALTEASIHPDLATHRLAPSIPASPTTHKRPVPQLLCRPQMLRKLRALYPFSRRMLRDQASMSHYKGVLDLTASTTRSGHFTIASNTIYC
jgi:hypothetical protein